jgi:hypothetical protein
MTKILEDTTQDPRDIEDTTEANGEELYEEVEIEEVILTTPRPSNLRTVENKICRGDKKRVVNCMGRVVRE